MYTLIDPTTLEIRYVGWSFQPKRRLLSHINNSRKMRTHRDRWIASLLARGERPQLEIVETGYNPGGWNTAEMKWIATHRERGARLTNATDGGEGTTGFIPGPETRAKMSAAQRGRVHTPERNAKLSASLRGRKQSPEHIAALSAVRKGRKPVAAAAAWARVGKGRKQTPEHVAARVKGNLSDESVRQIRLSSEPRKILAARHGVHVTMIGKIQRRQAYRAVV